MIEKKIGVLFLVIVFSISLSSAGWFSDFFGKVTGNVVYGQDSCVSSKLCLNNVYSTTGKQIDLYLPTDGSSGPWPTILYFHAGGWKSGSENDCSTNNAYRSYTDRGYVLACVGYRLTDGGKNPFPAQIHDAKAAVRWLRANSQKYNLDSNKIGALGGSAGGHLAALLGTSYGVSELEGSNLGNSDQSSKVAATVVLQGPTYLYPPKEVTSDPSAMFEYLGGDPTKNALAKQRADYADSRKYVDSSDGPFFLVYGNLDQIVKPVNGIKLSQTLNDKGVNNNLIYCNGGHGCPLDNKFNEYMKFFDDNLKNTQISVSSSTTPNIQQTGSFYSCNNNGKCENFETKKICSSDCKSFRYGFSEPLVFNSFAKSSEGWNFDRGLQEMEKFGVTVDRLMISKSVCLNSPTQVNENNCIVFKEAAQKLIDKGITPVGLDTDLSSMITGYSAQDSFVIPPRDLSANSVYMVFLNNYESSWYTLAAYLDNVHVWETGNEWNTGSHYMRYPNREMTDQEKAAVATDLMYRSKKAIKQANPDAFVFTPGFAMQGYKGNPSNLHIIVDQIYKNIKSGNWPSNNPRDYFDGWAWHPYTSNFDRDFVSMNNRVLAIIAANGDANVPIYFSEIGTPTPSASYVQDALLISNENFPSLWAIGWYRLFSQPGSGTDGEFYLVNGPKTIPAYQWNSAGTKFRDISLYYKNTFGQGYVGQVENLTHDANCQVNYWNQVYYGKNDAVGLSNSANQNIDYRFLCLDSRLYECGWELNEPNFAIKILDKQKVGNYSCNLLSKEWEVFQVEQEVIYNYSWQTGNWSECSGGSCAGGGIQQRSVECKRDDGAIVSETYCLEVKPSSLQSCVSVICVNNETCEQGLCVLESLSVENGSSTNNSFLNESNISVSNFSESTNNQYYLPSLNNTLVYNSLNDSLSYPEVVANQTNFSKEISGENCKGWFGVSYTAEHNKVGLSNGDPRFVCFDKKLYECGWSKIPLGVPWFASKAKNGQVVGNYVCDLSIDRWVSV